MSLCTIYYVFSEKMRDGRRGLVMSICTMYSDFLKANYFARPKFLLGNFAQVKGHKKP